MLEHLKFIKNYTHIPYKSWTDNGPYSNMSFPVYTLTETSFENFAWYDLALTQKDTIKIDLNKGDVWPEESMIRKFQTDTEYILFSAMFGAFDFIKYVLVTIDKNGNYVDSIAVSAAIFGKDGEYYYPLVWEITENMTVKTYQLKPTTSTPILCNSEIPNTLEAQRIDRTYSLDSNGKFSQIETKYYEPQNYSKDKFLNKGYDIASGNEHPIM